MQQHRYRLLPFVVEALGDEAIANPRLGLDVLLAGFGFELLAQLADKDAKVLWLVRRLRSPDRGQQGAMRNHLAGMSRQVKQQIEFLGRQVDGLPATSMLWAAASITKSPVTMADSVRSGARRRWARTRASSSWMLNGLVT